MSDPETSDLEKMLGGMLAEETITERDAEEIRTFAVFCADIGLASDIILPAGAKPERDRQRARAIPIATLLATLRKWKSYLGLTDEQIAAVAQSRGETV